MSKFQYHANESSKKGHQIRWAKPEKGDPKTATNFKNIGNGRYIKQKPATDTQSASDTGKDR